MAQHASFDRSVLKVNQVILMVGLVGGYLISLAWRPAAVVLPLLALMMLAAAASQSTSLPRLLYLHLLRPRGWVKQRPSVEDAAPHRFAQLLGGIVLAVGSVFALFGLIALAWVLGWIVVILAFLNFAFDLCVGCIIYVQLARAGVLPLHRSRA